MEETEEPERGDGGEEVVEEQEVIALKTVRETSRGQCPNKEVGRIDRLPPPVVIRRKRILTRASTGDTSVDSLTKSPDIRNFQTGQGNRNNQAKSGGDELGHSRYGAGLFNSLTQRTRWGIGKWKLIMLCEEWK